MAVLMEPTGALIEGGCQGTLRAEVTARGKRAHSARSWMGQNAIHGAGGILDLLRSYQPREPEVDGLIYHEGMNAVGIGGGGAGNVIPDECTGTVNYRVAPDRSEEEAAPPDPPGGLRPGSFVPGPWPCWPGGAPPRNPPVAYGPVPSSPGRGPAGLVKPAVRPPGWPGAPRNVLPLRGRSGGQFERAGPL